MKHKLLRKFNPDMLKILKYSKDILSVVVLVLAVFVLLGLVHPLSIMGTVAPNSYNKLGLANCSNTPPYKPYPCVLTAGAAQAVSAPYQNIASNVNISGNTYVQDSGGLNNGLKVNGRIQTGDSSGYGGVWVNSGDNLFVGAVDKASTKIGFFTGSTFPFYATGNQICLNGNCISNWPNEVPGYMSRLLTISTTTPCSGQNQNPYTLSSSEKFPNRIDAMTAMNAAAGNNPSNANVSIGPTNNSTTQQVYVWSGVGSCNYPSGTTFYIMVFGH